MLPPHALQGTHLRRVETLVIAPSRRIDDIAAAHQAALPAAVRAQLRGVGVGGSTAHAGGAALAIYLLVEAPYTQELMALGEADTMARQQEMLQFFCWQAKEKAPLQRGLEPGGGLPEAHPN
jgi:NTE family protein